MVLLLVVTACKQTGYPTAGVATPVPRSPTESLIKVTPTPTVESTPTLAAPTQPVYDPAQPGDLGKPNSYVLTSKGHIQKGTQSAGLEEALSWQYTLTVINTPRQAQGTRVTRYFATTDHPEQTTTVDGYWLGEATYTYNQEGQYWVIRPDGEMNKDYFFEYFKFELSSIKTARFVGQEDFQGVPANHFVFDLADWVADAQSPLKIESVQGNLFLAQDGNYPLHLDYIKTGDALSESAPGTSDITYLPGVTEFAMDISSINQVTEIVLSEDIPLQVKLSVDVPLPPDAKLSLIMVFQNATRLAYDYETDLSDDEIIAFYQAFQPANGWTYETVIKGPNGGGSIGLKKNGKLVLLNIHFNKYTKKNTIGYSYSP